SLPPHPPRPTPFPYTTLFRSQCSSFRACHHGYRGHHPARPCQWRKREQPHPDAACLAGWCRLGEPGADDPVLCRRRDDCGAARASVARTFGGRGSRNLSAAGPGFHRFLATAIITNFLAKRVIANEEIARERGVRLARQLHVNALIIEDARDGIVVVDPEGCI